MYIQNSKFANFRIMKRGTIQQCDNNLCFLETLPAVLCRLVADLTRSACQCGFYVQQSPAYCMTRIVCATNTSFLFLFLSVWTGLLLLGAAIITSDPATI